MCWNGAPDLETCQWEEGGGGEDDGGGDEGGEGDDVGVGWGDPPPPDCDFEPCAPCDPSEEDCPLLGISIALADDAVLPGGITSVTVTVQPPYPGVTVYLSSSVSGLDPSCNVPIGVFGDPEGETGSDGTFTTTYKAGLDVGAETIYADVSDAFDNLFTDEARGAGS